jgi:hypothetical protein
MDFASALTTTEALIALFVRLDSVAGTHIYLVERVMSVWRDGENRKKEEDVWRCFERVEKASQLLFWAWRGIWRFNKPSKQNFKEWYINTKDREMLILQRRPGLDGSRNWKTDISSEMSPGHDNSISSTSLSP